ncbi:hypothetical protein QU38_02520, partial [Staphylococcus aureus]
LHQPLDHRARRRRAADGDDPEEFRLLAGRVHVLEHREPHGGYAGGMRHLLAVHQLAQDQRIIDCREDELDPRRSAGPGQTPADRMEHRHDRHRHRTRREIEHVGLHLGDRMDHAGTMRIDHALGIARGAAGVADHARLALAAGHPAVIAVLSGEQRLEPVRPVAVEAVIMLDRLPVRLQSLDQRREGTVVE